MRSCAVLRYGVVGVVRVRRTTAAVTARTPTRVLPAGVAARLPRGGAWSDGRRRGDGVLRAAADDDDGAEGEEEQFELQAGDEEGWVKIVGLEVDVAGLESAEEVDENPGRRDDTSAPQVEDNWQPSALLGCVGNAFPIYSISRGRCVMGWIRRRLMRTRNACTRWLRRRVAPGSRVDREG